MKESIQWHEECLKNRQNSLLRERKTLEILLTKIERLFQENNAYAYQIQQAKLRKMDHFDRDRFLKKRGKK